ncbi:MAG: VWA domain-containing protein [bacterium]|nr:VWA domain-containing protein [bacterium]
MIHFGSPNYFWFCAALSVFILSLNIFTLKRIGIFRRLDAARILMWSGVVLFLGMIISDAKLEWKKAIPVKEKLEIVFALDISLSSLACDVIIEEGDQWRKISRLDFEKQQVENVIEILSGDAVGIIVFADKAFPLQIVLSREDYRHTLLRNLKYIDKDFIRYGISQGTDYGNLIMVALEQFGKKNSAKKVLFILTDGEAQGNEEKLRENLKKAIEIFSQRDDIAVYLIGIGNSREPSMIPKTEDAEGNPKEYYCQNQGEAKGQPILTRPNPEFLTRLANMTDGHYFQATSGKDLKNILESSIERERRIIGFQEKSKMVDLTPYLLISSLIFLFAIPIIKSV